MTDTTPISTNELVELVKLSVIAIDGYPIDAFNIQEVICSRLLASDAWAQNYGSAMQRLQALEKRCDAADEMEKALVKLSFMAQTSGGTAGRDEGLCEAISKSQKALADYNEASL